jgi:hypothetical protein
MFQQHRCQRRTAPDDQLRPVHRLDSAHALDEALASGIPVFYTDADGVNIMERDDGRKFEVRWLPGAPSGENYEVIRELTAHAA